MSTDRAMPPRIAGIVLAGGQSRRMGGGDKSLRLLAGRPILARIIERAAPQVERLALNANGDPRRFAGFGLEVVADDVPDFAGPLAGILAGLDWAARLPWVTHLASFAGDAPFLPHDLVARLSAAVVNGAAPLACAASDGRTHPVFGLWPLALRDDLRRAVVEEGVRKVDRWTARHGIVAVPFDAAPADPFFNVNSPEDLAAAETLAGGATDG